VESKGKVAVSVPSGSNERSQKTRGCEQNKTKRSLLAQEKTTLYSMIVADQDSFYSHRLCDILGTFQNVRQITQQSCTAVRGLKVLWLLKRKKAAAQLHMGTLFETAEVVSTFATKVISYFD
jgi:hypothetical protein